MSSYKTYLMMLLLSAVGSYLLTPLAIRLAYAWGAVDLPSARKIHTQPMPRLGGIAVFFGFCLPWAGLYLLHNPVSKVFQNYEILFFSLLLGATLMLCLGIYDDIWGANAVQKFLFQIAIACLLWSFGFRISQFSIPFGPPLVLHPILSLGVTVLWIVGVTNAINLLDGIDGLVSGVTAVIALSLAMINIFSNQILLGLLTLALTGACLGFLPYNYSPARIFLGDSGSLTIGLVLACIGVLSLFNDYGGGASPFISVPLILFGLPLFDTARVMVTRMLTGVPIFQADKNHVHHQLLGLGLTQKQAAWTLYGVAVLTGSISVLLTTLESGGQLLLSVLFAILSIVTYFIWKFSLRPRTSEAAKVPPGS
ncbi:MAG: undecaprenyl/decaprenyl-phosphate alpha-N-acetylglucosaminyl 1-phosphate transferase [Pedosphaera sp.]|nr:undecaprenyl/decaprenyl-phosphate alpha-N-acetylglucosaminyl 1-phosphate transferase [Pedosphaera sp.]